MDLRIVERDSRIYSICCASRRSGKGLSRDLRFLISRGAEVYDITSQVAEACRSKAKQTKTGLVFRTSHDAAQIVAILADRIFGNVKALYHVAL